MPPSTFHRTRGTLAELLSMIPTNAFPSLLLLLTVFAGMAHSRSIYIDPSLQHNCKGTAYSVVLRSCSGSNGAGYKTFSSVSSKLRPGDIVFFRAGIYTSPIVVKSNGSDSKHLRLEAYSAESVVINLSGASSNASGIDVSGHRYVDISGLSVTNAPLYGFNAQNAANISLSNCEVSFSKNGGVIAVSSSNIYIAGCRVHHNNKGGISSMMEAVSLQNVNTFLVANSQVYQNGKEGIDSKYGSTNGLITGNISYQNAATNIYLDGTSNITVARNIAYDVASSEKPGIGIAVESTYNTGKYPTANVEIANNIVYGNGAGITFWIENGGLGWATISNVRIEYNTIADNCLNNWGGIVLSNGSPSNYGLGNVIQNNIFWNDTFTGGSEAIRDDAKVSSLFLVRGNLFEKGKPSATFGIDYATASINPFTGEALHDYHLASISAARGVGIPDGHVLVDFDGRVRSTSRTDAGAYENPAN
jgi:hypothetical protein